MKHSLHLYGTLGPACASKEKIQAMFLAGMTGMRLNLSHSNLGRLATAVSRSFRTYAYHSGTSG